MADPRVSSHPSPLPAEEFEPPVKDGATGLEPVRTKADDEHVDIGWRSWLVVLCACIALFSQIFVVVAAGSVIAFIVRDIGHPNLAGWIIQGPLLVQSVLSPVAGRLSDVVDRKNLAMWPPLIAVAGAVVSARANSMGMLIGGGLLIGVTLASSSIVGAIPSEVLPMKSRANANGYLFIAGGLGAIVGTLGSGAVTNANPKGWRNIFWMQAAFHSTTFLCFLCFYWPKRRVNSPKVTFRSVVWACDPIGSLLFIGWVTLILLGFDWSGGSYKWSDAHVAAPLGIGGGLFVLFCLYEWKGRSDGLLAHIFFRNRNFTLAVLAFTVEGWLFYSAFNSVVPQIVLNLGFETNAWKISLRTLSSQIPSILCVFFILAYTSRFKDLKTPLFVTFGLFLVATIMYACITPSMNKFQYAIAAISGMGQAGPLTLIVALVQYSAPHAYLSTATGLAYSFRAIGGAFGSAVIDTIINNNLTSYAAKVSAAAIKAGLPPSSAGPLLMGFATGNPALIAAVPGINPAILRAASNESHKVYAHAYRLAWASVIPFVVIAMIMVAFLRNVKNLMTERVEATVELAPAHKEDRIEGT